MSAHLRIRRATAADAPMLAQLIDELGYRTDPASLVARMRSLPEGHTVLVAERGAGVVGFVHVALDPSLLVERRAQIAGIAVAPDHRRDGIGARLLDRAAAWAREHGCHHLWIRSGSHRDAAHGFYRATGCEQIDGQVVFRRVVEGTVDLVDGTTTAAPVVVSTRPSV